MASTPSCTDDRSGVWGAQCMTRTRPSDAHARSPQAERASTSSLIDDRDRFGVGHVAMAISTRRDGRTKTRATTVTDVRPSVPQRFLEQPSPHVSRLPRVRSAPIDTSLRQSGTSSKEPHPRARIFSSRGFSAIDDREDFHSCSRGLKFGEKENMKPVKARTEPGSSVYSYVDDAVDTNRMTRAEVKANPRSRSFPTASKPKQQHSQPPQKKAPSSFVAAVQRDARAIIDELDGILQRNEHALQNTKKPLLPQGLDPFPDVVVVKRKDGATAIVDSAADPNQPVKWTLPSQQVKQRAKQQKTPQPRKVKEEETTAVPAASRAPSEKRDETTANVAEEQKPGPAPAPAPKEAIKAPPKETHHVWNKQHVLVRRRVRPTKVPVKPQTRSSSTPDVPANEPITSSNKLRRNVPNTLVEWVVGRSIPTRKHQVRRATMPAVSPIPASPEVPARQPAIQALNEKPKAHRIQAAHEIRPAAPVEYPRAPRGSYSLGQDAVQNWHPPPILGSPPIPGVTWQPQFFSPIHSVIPGSWEPPSTLPPGQQPPTYAESQAGREAHVMPYGAQGAYWALAPGGPPGSGYFMIPTGGAQGTHAPDGYYAAPAPYGYTVGTQTAAASYRPQSGLSPFPAWNAPSAAARRASPVASHTRRAEPEHIKPCISKRSSNYHPPTTESVAGSDGKGSKASSKKSEHSHSADKKRKKGSHSDKKEDEEPWCNEIWGGIPVRVARYKFPGGYSP